MYLLDNMFDVKYIIVMYDIIKADDRAVLIIINSFYLQTITNALLAAGESLVVSVKIGEIKLIIYLSYRRSNDSKSPKFRFSLHREESKYN